MKRNADIGLFTKPSTYCLSSDSISRRRNMRGFYMAGVVVFVFCLCSCAPQNIISDSQSPDKPDAFSLDAGGKKLSKSLTDSLRRQNPGKIAVVGFEGPGQKITPFGEYLSEKLSLRLCNNPVFTEIMERKELDRIIQAHNLEYGLFFDQDTVEDFGKLIGADSIVIGKIQDLGTSYDVTDKADEAD